jgi:hypothetical protein
MSEKEEIVRELTEAIAYMTDVKGLEGSEKEWWDEMKRDITGLRGSIEGEQVIQTKKSRTSLVRLMFRKSAGLKRLMRGVNTRFGPIRDMCERCRKKKET